MNTLARIQGAVTRTSARVDWLAPLLARLVVGSVFTLSGWGKLTHIDRTIAFFDSLGIPAPAFQAHLVGSIELFGGLLLFAGLLSRAVAVPLAFTMVVAIATAKWDDVHGIRDLLALEESQLLVLAAWIALAGPGRASLDELIARRLQPKNATKGERP